MRKLAVMSMDVEDWYHVDYFERSDCDVSYSLLDGVESYVSLLEELHLKSSFFVLGEIAEKRIEYFRELVLQGFDVGSHGWSHIRPLTMSTDSFREDLQRSMQVIRDVNGNRSLGYRAPCFSLDRSRLDIVRDAGFTYDSSKIEFGLNSLYGSINMSGFENLGRYVYRYKDFIEFEVTTASLVGRNVPISGGGYLRILPWSVTKTLLRRHFKDNEIYIFYIHPFELSSARLPVLPSSASVVSKLRFSYGRSAVENRIRMLVDLLANEGYEFTTFRDIHREIISDSDLP